MEMQVTCVFLQLYHHTFELLPDWQSLIVIFDAALKTYE